jgi:opacity protein-like surface antigen
VGGVTRRAPRRRSAQWGAPARVAIALTTLLAVVAAVLGTPTTPLTPDSVAGAARGAGAGAAATAGSPATQNSADGSGGNERNTGALPLPDPIVPERIEVVDQTTFVGPGSTLSIGLRIADVGPDTTLSLTLHQPVGNRIQLGSTVGGTELGGVVKQTDAVDVRDLPTDAPAAGTPGADPVVRLQFLIPGPDTDPANPFVLPVDQPGVYPLVISLDGPDGGEQVVTHVVRPPAVPTDGETPPVPLSVATLVRLDGDVAVTAEGNPELTPTDATRLAGVTDTLATAPVPATVQTTGAVLDALAAAEPAAPLRPALDGRLLRPTWTPVSVTDLLAAGQAPFLERQLVTGGESATTRAGTPGSTEMAVLDAGVDPDGLTALAGLGVRGVVVPESLAAPLDPGRFPATLTQSFTVLDGAGTPLPALQTDLVLTALLNSSDQPALAANRVLADLAILAFDFPDLQRAAVLDTGADVDPRTLQLVLAALAPAVNGPAGTVALLEARTVAGALAEATPVTGGLERSWIADDPADLGTWPARLAATDAAALSLATTVTPTADGSWAAGIVASVNQLTLASGEAGIATTARNRLLDDADALVADTLAAIGIPPQGTVTLTSDAGVVPVTLVNGLPEQVTVRLSVLSDKLEFPDGDTLELTLDPGTNRREVAVRTRATGSFPVELDLRTADGSIVIATGRLSVRSTAFSGLGLVLSIVAGVFLAVWWGLQLRSARRSRQLIDTPAPASDVDETSAVEPTPDGPRTPTP